MSPSDQKILTMIGEFIEAIDKVGSREMGRILGQMARLKEISNSKVAGGGALVDNFYSRILRMRGTLVRVARTSSSAESRLLATRLLGQLRAASPHLKYGFIHGISLVNNLLKGIGPHMEVLMSYLISLKDFLSPVLQLFKFFGNDNDRVKLELPQNQPVARGNKPVKHFSV
jgi:hypothetical protein